MTGKERRNEIINLIKSINDPISGTELAKRYGVSRQVIVQDIALLRAENYDIFSTTRGYILQKSAFYTRIFDTCHRDDQIEDELNTIVDLGGIIVDVFIRHEVYGNLKAELGINNRRAVKEFITKIQNGSSTPLKNLTSGRHFHTVQADSEKVLDMIEKELREKGYIV